MAGGILSGIGRRLPAPFRRRGNDDPYDDPRLATYISFHAEVNQTTSEALISVVAHEMSEGRRNVHLTLSTPGGGVANGLAVYNTLRGMPIRLTTYNVGSVNSIGNVIYLAGSERFACRSSSFMFHGVGFDLSQTTRVEEKDLVEQLDSIRTDQDLIAAVIRERTGISAEEAHGLFLRAAFMGVEEAKTKGIVHEIRELDVPEGAPFLQLVFER